MVRRDLNGERVDDNTDDNRKLIYNFQQLTTLAYRLEHCDNFEDLKPKEYDINNNDSIRF